MLAVHHICKTFLPLKGGVEVVVDSMCKATKSDVDSTVISTKRNQLDEVYEFANLKLSRSYLELFSLPVAPSILFEVWRSFKVTDVLCIHAPFPLADLGVSLFGFFYRKKRVVVYWHAQIYSQKLLKFFVLPFSYLMLLRADQIAVASPPMLENSGLLKRFKHKVIVLPYSLSQADHHQTGFNDEGDFFLAIGNG